MSFFAFGMLTIFDQGVFYLYLHLKCWRQERLESWHYHNYLYQDQLLQSLPQISDTKCLLPCSLQETSKNMRAGEWRLCAQRYKNGGELEGRGDANQGWGDDVTCSMMNQMREATINATDGDGALAEQQ